MARGRSAPLTNEELNSVVEAYRGANTNTSAAARFLKMDRGTFRSRLQKAAAAGLLGEEELRDPLTPDRDTYMSARARRVAAFQKKQRKGAWDKPVLIRLPDRPFRLKLFGDPHLDADGCDYELFERHWLEMDAANGVYGVCIGDWFNNWLRVLGHLWKHEGDPDDAWLCLEHLMAERGDALIAACSGNHDDWTHGPADPVDMLMKRHGVVYRQGAVRLFVQAGEHLPVSVALRHKWRGHSMYSPAHGLRKAAASGWGDDIMVGGHTHVDEDRHYVEPRTGLVSHLFQLSAFKKFDDFADTHGFTPHAISPVRDLVVQPGRARTDPDRVRAFYDSRSAAAFLEAVR